MGNVLTVISDLVDALWISGLVAVFSVVIVALLYWILGDRTHRA